MINGESPEMTLAVARLSDGVEFKNLNDKDKSEGFFFNLLVIT